MSLELENLILASLIHLPEYSNKVYPQLKEKFFEAESQKLLFKIYATYQQKYNSFPEKEAIIVELSNTVGLNTKIIDDAKAATEKLYDISIKESLSRQKMDWLLDTSLKHLQNRACYLAVMESLSIIDGEDKKLDKGAIPDIMRDALSISFDNDIGHDYFENAEERFAFYNKKENKIKMSLEMLNKITGGGIPKKALVVPLAPTGVGKTLYLCSEAAFQLTEGRNVLYITLEMAEERIAERIDANLMDLNIGDIKEVPKDSFLSKIDKMKQKSTGKLIVKEYPPGTFHANHLRFLLKDLETKKSFKPDIIMIDYLNLLSSYRMKSADQTYTYMKAVTEELRGVMLEYDILGISPTQTNREGQNASDYELNQMSDSHGVSMTADMIFGLISTPELEKIGRLMFKQLKNRFGSLDYYTRFMVGVNRSKMKIYDVHNEDQKPSGQQSSPMMNLNSQKKETSGLKF